MEEQIKYMVFIVFKKEIVLPFSEEKEKDILYINVKGVHTGLDYFVQITFNDDSVIFINKEDISAIQVDIQNDEMFDESDCSECNGCEDKENNIN